MSINLLAGKVAEVRLHFEVEKVLTVYQDREIRPVIQGFNSRGDGNFKLAIAEKHFEIDAKLAAELREHFSSFFRRMSLKDYSILEFRINYTTIDDGLMWEGFGVHSHAWLRFTPEGGLATKVL